MALHTSLPIYKVAYDLLDVVTDVTRNMPRDFKVSIGGRIRDEARTFWSAAESDIALTTIVEAAANLLEACSSRASFRVVDDKLVVLIWDDLGRKDYPYGRAA